jgi:SepF-like predicted cell division protein (DUF552 family)
MGGDMAQLKNTTIVILTPNGIKIAKQKWSLYYCIQKA